MTQYGFFIDLSRCTGCNACVIACKQWHGIEPGPMKWIRVHQWEKGSFPDIDLRILPIMCFHCEQPLCAEACPNKAITKDEQFGAVLVDPSKCKGERKCWEACPYGTPQFKSDDPGEKMAKCNMCVDRLKEGLTPICVLSCSLRALEFGPIDELREKYGDNAERQQTKGSPLCSIGCPAKINPEEYIRKMSEGKWKEALDIFRKATPFAGILGRVCSHLCELDCLRGRFDDAVSIRSLKRYMGDRELEYGRERNRPIPFSKKEKVAIVGSGPAGLSCAYDLARQGYPVTIFEAADEPGGLMRYGIPEYRLPVRVLENEISYIEELGVEIMTRTPVENIEGLFSRGFGAVFVATGAWKSMKLGVSGEDEDNVLYALDFLKKAKVDGKIETGKRTVVVGGGSVAMDTARTALRMGAAEVHVVCLESMDLASKDRMPARDDEIEDARQEGVLMHPCLGISRIITEGGRVRGVEGMECTSVIDDSGKFNPEFNECNIPAIIEADQVIIAIGQAADLSMLEGIKTENGRVKINPLTLQTENSGIFAGGDFVTGPLDVISAVAAGKEAAISIDRYLNGKDLEDGRRIPSPSSRKRLEFKSLRQPLVDITMRHDFTEVEMGYDEHTALEQAGRCLKCGNLNPSVVIRRVDPKKKIVPWDVARALELWKKRQPAGDEMLPDIFEDYTEVTDDPGPEMMGRNRLVLKPVNSEEKMFYTTDDE
ncbi:MAG: FAD-dependent oxidoreductase [Deltaproteobacteria bacterium]|nr:FAD-dependent oxidoreductase [Deltaproteobacteria bacterium]